MERETATTLSDFEIFLDKQPRDPQHKIRRGIVKSTDKRDGSGIICELINGRQGPLWLFFLDDCGRVMKGDVVEFERDADFQIEVATNVVRVVEHTSRRGA